MGKIESFGFSAILAKNLNRRRRKAGSVRMEITTTVEAPLGGESRSTGREVIEVRPGDTLSFVVTERIVTMAHADGEQTSTAKTTTAIRLLGPIE